MLQLDEMGHCVYKSDLNQILAKARDISGCEAVATERALQQGVANFNSLSKSSIGLAISESCRGLDLLVRAEEWNKRPRYVHLMQKILHVYVQINLFPLRVAAYLGEYVPYKLPIIISIVLVALCHLVLAVYLLGFPVAVLYALSIVLATCLSEEVNGKSLKGFNIEGWTKRLQEDDLPKVREFFNNVQDIG